MIGGHTGVAKYFGGVNRIAAALGNIDLRSLEAMMAVHHIGLAVPRIFPDGNNAGFLRVPLGNFAELFANAALAHVRLELEAGRVYVDFGRGDIANPTGFAFTRKLPGSRRLRTGLRGPCLFDRGSCIWGGFRRGSGLFDIARLVPFRLAMLREVLSLPVNPIYRLESVPLKPK